MTRQQRKERMEEYCRHGLMTVNMLFGAVNALRSMMQLNPYSTPSNLARAIREAGIKPELVERVLSGRAWFKPEPVIAALLRHHHGSPVRMFMPCDVASSEELASGEWQPMNICRIKTGLPAHTISGWASKGLTPWRVDPENNNRLFHLPSLHERSCYRDCKSLIRFHGRALYEQLLATRKTKYINDTLWVYAPELTIFPQPEDEQVPH